MEPPLLHFGPDTCTRLQLISEKKKYREENELKATLLFVHRFCTDVCEV